MEPTTHRIKIKIGNAEFEAEGKPDLVKKQFDDFMAAVNKLPQPTAAGTTTEPPPNPTPNDKSVNSNNKPSQALIDRVFRQDDPLSLMDTPKTDNAEADALLVLIYGHTELKGEQDVTAAALVKSASKTGLKIARISRTVATRSEFIRSSGMKKGTRYSLNNRGIAEAQRLIKAMVE